MPFWSRLLDSLRALRRPRAQSHIFELDEPALQTLRDLAAREQRPPDELARALLHKALRDQQEEDDARVLWHTLTPREQQVVALICMRYSNTQIASRLNISSETVKTHAHHALQKFGVQNRSDLRMRMLHWDFSRWDDVL